MSTFDVILFPTDFTKEADQALHLACAIARDHFANLVVVHVLPPSIEESELDEDSPDVQECREAFLAIKAREPDLPITFRLLRGFPVGMILNVAHEEGADLIVMASSQKTPAYLRLHGSVTEGVLRQAHCPVCCVRQPTTSLTTAQHDSSARDRASKACSEKDAKQKRHLPS